MRFSIALLILSIATGAAAQAETPGGQSFNWQAWRYLPVQDGGRHKPLDTLAWETLRTLCNRARFVEPGSRETLDSTAVYLAMLFDWQGWDRPADPHAMAMNPSAVYFAGYAPDKWDKAPMLRVDYLALRTALGVSPDEKYVSPLELSEAVIRDPHTEKQTPFLAWARELSLTEKEKGLTTFEQKGVELAGKFLAYQDHRMGRRLCVLPIRNSEDRQWASIADLMQTRFNDGNDPGGEQRAAVEQFQAARLAYLNGDAEEFNRASAALLATVGTAGPQLGEYADPQTIDLEVAYNHWAPFRFAWVFTTFAFLLLLLSMGTGWRSFYALGWLTFAAGLIAMIVGFWLRTTVSGRAPVTNMYESVIYLALGTAGFGVVFEAMYRRKFVLTAAAAVATVALILADNCPAVLDPSLKPLQPVLRSNFWLVTHVMSITLSYAALALALGIGNITLGYFLVGSKNREVVSALSDFTYKTLQVGVLLLAVGTILGGVWADYAWGRFWGWDPKEVWALIALLGYLAVLHARYVGWVGHLGLAALSVICFSLVVMAWYGVNFVLGAGLHSYGFGGGGQQYVYGAVLAQFLYVGAAALRSTQNGLS
jgi:cytochrome c-type biogenesis protein CcsB